MSATDCQDLGIWLGGIDGSASRWGWRLRADCCDLATIIQLVLSLISIIPFHFAQEVRLISDGIQTPQSRARGGFVNGED